MMLYLASSLSSASVLSNKMLKRISPLEAAAVSGDCNRTTLKETKG